VAIETETKWCQKQAVYTYLFWTLLIKDFCWCLNGNMRGQRMRIKIREEKTNRPADTWSSICSIRVSVVCVCYALYTTNSRLLLVGLSEMTGRLIGRLNSPNKQNTRLKCNYICRIALALHGARSMEPATETKRSGPPYHWLHQHNTIHCWIHSIKMCTCTCT
jgi:hypothetical protein